MRGRLFLPSCCALLALAAAVAFAARFEAANPSPAGTRLDGRPFVSAVQVDEVDLTVRGQIERVRGLLAERQWHEALDGLRQLIDLAPDKLVAVTPQRYLPLRAWCQRQLVALPAEALKSYRQRTDPVAKPLYERGIAQRDRAILENIVDEMFASSYGDKALWALAQISLEAAEYAPARHFLEPIVAPQQPSDADTLASARLYYPDTSMDPARIRATLVLVSILEGAHQRAQEELREYERLHPDAKGRLGEQQGPYLELLRHLLSASKSWPKPRTSPDWSTFAGNPQRNKIAPALIDVGNVAWRSALLSRGAEEWATVAKPREASNCYPVSIGERFFVSNGEQILAFDRRRGQPAWAGTPIIYSNVDSALGQQARASNGRPLTPHTLTVHRNLLVARLRGKVDGQHHGTALAGRGEMVCLDLEAEGRLLWKNEPEEGWAFEGTPVVDDQGVYVGMRRLDARTQLFVACFAPDSGRLRWRTFVCSSDVSSERRLPDELHGLLTLANDTIYYNTNAGAVAAVDRRKGQVRWLALYPRAKGAEDNGRATRGDGGPNPCLLAGDSVYVAPTDSRHVFAFDAFGGQLLWQSSELDDVRQLLGIAGNRLLVDGRHVYWISTEGEDAGRVKRRWPDGDPLPPSGRGLLTEDSLLLPIKERIVALDPIAGSPRTLIELSNRGATAGNLLVVAGQLLVASDSEVIALGMYGGKRNNP